MNLKPIKTETDYKEALKKMELIFDAKLGTDQSDEADILAVMIEDYEKKHHFIQAPDPIEAIKIRMEEMQLNQNDLVKEIGGTNKVTEILNKKKKLTIKMIRNLTNRLNLPTDILINDYKLVR